MTSLEEVNLLKNISIPGIMRNFLLLLAVAVLGLSKSAVSQTDINIGTGTAGNANTYPCPLQDWYEGSRAQYLFRASELNAAGMAAGNINAIRFNVTNLNGYSGDIQQMEVKIGSTATASLSTSSTVWETTVR